MKKITLASLFALLFLTPSFSQTNEEVDSRKILLKGLELHDDEMYDEAILEYKKVNKNDTNYVVALLELYLSYSALEQDSLAVVSCDKMLEQHSSYSPKALLYKANALDRQKKYDEAIACYKEGLKKYPLNNSFYYEYGVLRYNQKKYKEAHDLIVKSIGYNPYHAKSHLVMGNIAAKQGKLVPTILAYQYYLLLDNSSSLAEAVINDLELMIKNEYDFDSVVKVPGLSELDNFEEIESIVRSKAAFSSKYKSDVKINYTINKQLQLISEKMEINEDDKGFYMQFYAPILKEQYKRGFFAPYVYSILSGMGLKDVNSWNKKHKDVRAEWTTWLLKYLGEKHATFEAELNGKKVIARHWYSNNNNKISSIGNINSAGENIGYWNYYFSTGIINAEGAYNSKSQRIGVWKFYNEEGVVQAEENYVAGEVEGIKKKYYTNESIKSVYNYDGSELDGLQTLYYATGVKSGDYNYKSGEKDGLEISYHETGKKDYQLNIVDGEYEGAYVGHYDDGNISEKSTFKAGKREGKRETFYRVPANKLKATSTYKDGIAVGEIITYYRNGQIKKKGSCDTDGNYDGLWYEYYADGTIESESLYSKGNYNGLTKNYSQFGVLTEEILYKNNLLQTYKVFDKTEKILFQSKKDGRSDYDMVLYYPNGNKRKEGKIVGGNSEGAWKSYDLNGYLSYEVNYINDNKDGKAINYFENGQIESVMNYVDGVTDGFYKEYYKSGQLYREGGYVSSQMVGLWKKYYKNGTIRSEEFYKNDELDGWQTYYDVEGKINYEDNHELGLITKRVSYDSDGKAFSTIEFDNGSVNFELTYPNGKKRISKVYKNNILQGAYIAYYPNGTIRKNIKYVDGYIQGDAEYFYANGQLRAIDPYVNGKLHGKGLKYYKDGNLRSEINYVYGSKNGTATWYYKNKQIEISSNYRNGNRNGKLTMYDQLTGKVLLERTYENGYIVSYRYKDKTGKFVAPILIENETATIKAFSSNGKPSYTYTLKNGYKNGKQTVWFFNGNVEVEATYIEGNLEGEYKSYYPSGKIKEVENYSNGKQTGKSIYYYESGKVKSEEQYLNDEGHGVFKEYNSAGKLIHTHVYRNGYIIDEL